MSKQEARKDQLNFQGNHQSSCFLLYVQFVHYLMLYENMLEDFSFQLIILKYWLHYVH